MSEPTTEPRRATHVDPDSGGRETAEFFAAEAGDVDLFGVTYVPEGPVHSGAVLCPPVLAEFHRSYWFHTMIARRLVTLGVAVQRFHYRGSGHSGGEPHDLTLESMTADVRRAVGHFSSQIDARLVVVGTGCGWLSAVGGAPAGAPVAGVQPMIDGTRYFKEAFRANMIKAARHSDSSPVTSADSLLELAETGSTELLGETLYQALHASLSTPSTLDLSADGPRLLIELTNKGELSSAYQRLADSLGSTAPVEVACVPGRSTWWVDAGWAPNAERARLDAESAERVAVGLHSWIEKTLSVSS